MVVAAGARVVDPHQVREGGVAQGVLGEEVLDHLLDDGLDVLVRVAGHAPSMPPGALPGRPGPRMRR